MNLKGTFFFTQEMSRAMISSKSKNGSIINISSIVGKSGNVGQCNYSGMS